MPHHLFAEKLLHTLQHEGVQKTFAKGEFVIREGEIERHIYFVASGAIRVFLLSEHEELTVRFGYEGSFINSLSSFIKQSPSEFYIEAIRKTTLHMIDREHFRTLVQQNEETQAQYNAMLEILVTQQIEREIDLLTVSPSERLKRVLARSPNLFQEIPLKYIASYLRMTPETLSRVRNS